MVTQDFPATLNKNLPQERGVGASRCTITSTIILYTQLLTVLSYNVTLTYEMQID